MHTFKKLPLLLGLTTALFSSFALGADIPANTKLAAKQEVHLHYTNDVITLDPQFVESLSDRHLANQLFEGLVSIDPEGNVIPGVATRWEISEDGKKWTFFLRDNAKWSNGDAVTAQDFVFGWQRLANPKTAAPYISYLKLTKLANVEEITHGKKSVDELGIKAIGDKTLELTLSEPVPYLDLLLQNPVLFPVHRATLEKYGEQWTNAKHIVSNGAYKVQDRTVNEKITLVPNSHYWDNARTVIQKATILMLEKTPAFAHYRANQLDLSNIPENFFVNKKFREEYKDQIQANLQLATYRYEINTTKPPLNDVRVRKALNLALDRDLITQKILGYDEHTTFTFTPTYIHLGNQIQQPSYAKWTQAQRNEQAKKLLMEAGYSKEKPLVIELTHSTNQNTKHVTLTSKAAWEKNLDGMVKVNLKGLEWKILFDAKQMQNFELITSSWFADYNEASTFLSFYHSQNHKNKTGFASAKFDESLAQANQVKDNVERAKHYAAAEAELETEQPFIAIYHYVDLIVKKPKLKGYEGKNPQGDYLIKHLYFVQ
ncbi:MAG: peptide ABC transporter substrate-binding protein [Pasteurellaceae bacterium]|nr:peptide ABC transporter substrate-binding protein [Pasteurellaceae bacterium]